MNDIDARSQLLHNHTFRTLLAARATSIFGNAQAPVALSFAVLATDGGGAAELSVVLLCKEITQALLFVVGGTVSDRLSRKTVLVSADLLAGTSQAAAAGLVWSGHASVWMLAVSAACNGAAFAFFYPAATAALPQTVERSQLHSANALMRFSIQGMSIAGAAGGGAVIAVTNPAAGLAIDAGTFFLSGMLLLSIRLTAVPAAGADSFLRELRLGWSEFTGRRWLWGLVLQYSVISMVAIGIMGALGPIVSERSMSGAASWALYLAAEATGLLLGTIVCLRVRPQRPLRVVVLVGVLLALPPVVLAVHPTNALLAVSGMLAGAGYSIASINWSSTLQRQIRPEVLGRVTSYDALGSWALVPVGLAIAGPLSAVLSPSAVLLGGAVAVVAASLPWLLLGDVRKIRADDEE